MYDNDQKPVLLVRIAPTAEAFACHGAELEAVIAERIEELGVELSVSLEAVLVCDVASSGSRRLGDLVAMVMG